MFINTFRPRLSQEQDQMVFEPENDDEVVFAPEEGELVFASEDKQRIFAPKWDENKGLDNWKILIVDDDLEIHNITKLLLKNFTFEGRNVVFTSAFSGREAQPIIEQNPDTALILLDVVMETDEAGLQFVKYVREVLQNDSVQIVLRTGQPGQVPEMVIVEDYYINDYKTKTELTKPKLFTTIRTALRTFSSIYKLRLSEARERQKSQQLEKALEELKHTQMQLIQSEKMSSLGQLVAGIAHEINNPVNFIHGNLQHTRGYIQDLLKIIELYQNKYPNPDSELGGLIEDLDLEFLIEDLNKILSSMEVGSERITAMVKSLRNFSRLDEARFKKANIHEGLESTLMILHHRLKAKSERPEIKVIKEYGPLPGIECYPSQLNQAFLHIISNAIDTIEAAHKGLGFIEVAHKGLNFTDIQNYPGIITISTEVTDTKSIIIRIMDNGEGIEETLSHKLFEPFFTTKTVGKGTGLGLSIAYQVIVDLHKGKIDCNSTPGKGTEFVLEIPGL